MKFGFYLMCAVVVYAYGGYVLLGVFFNRFTKLFKHED
jgi:hypothetical protein